MNSPSFSEILEQLEIPASHNTKMKLKMYTSVVLLKQHGFILHSLEYNAGDTLVVDNEIGMTASLGIISKLAAGTGPNNSLLPLAMQDGELDNLITKCKRTPG